jgi:hypothetical protein
MLYTVDTLTASIASLVTAVGLLASAAHGQCYIDGIAAQQSLQLT